jgi:tetratricopeptide (TPR) repeat protein
MKTKPVALNQLPQTSEVWIVCQRALSLELGNITASPTMLAVLNLTDSYILRLDVYESEPEPELVRDLLLHMMRMPEQEELSPHRPKEVMFEQAALLEAIAPALREIKVATSAGEAPPMLDNLISELNQAFASAPVELPGLLSIPGTNPKMIASLFEAAAGFYRLAPWKRIANDQTLAVTIDPPGEQLFVQVLGNGGMEFGLSLYRSWEDVVRMFEYASSPMELVPETGVHGLTFEDKNDLPPDDQEALRKYGWKTAGRKACPMPIIFTTDGGAIRPERQELLYYEALLRALPGFIEQNLTPDGRGDFQATEAVIETRSADGPVRLTIGYPAGELPESYMEFFGDEDEGDSLELPDELVEANRLADQAWEENDPAERLRLARQALELSADCCEACLVLAYLAETETESHEWLEKAAQAGVRLLGQDFIDENAGYLWDYRQARPYLRALDGLGESLEELGRPEEALEMYKTLLDLNEEDHQGARYDAVRLMLQLNRDEDADELLEEFEDDGSATWAYSRALLAFRQAGNAASSRAALKKALRTNRHAPAFLTGAKPLPEETPNAVGFGDESEAIVYAQWHYALWWSTPGAVDWLKKQKGNI